MGLCFCEIGSQIARYETTGGGGPGFWELGAETLRRTSRTAPPGAWVFFNESKARKLKIELEGVLALYRCSSYCYCSFSEAPSQSRGSILLVSQYYS